MYNSIARSGSFVEQLKGPFHSYTKGEKSFSVNLITAPPDIGYFNTRKAFAALLLNI